MHIPSDVFDAKNAYWVAEREKDHVRVYGYTVVVILDQIEKSANIGRTELIKEVVTSKVDDTIEKLQQLGYKAFLNDKKLPDAYWGQKSITIQWGEK